jgi:hypothetical protein
MTTKTKVTSTTKKNSRVKSDTINVSGVNVAAPVGGVGSNNITDSIGVSSVVDSRSLSADHVAHLGGSTNKDKSHNNATSQLDALITIEEQEKQAKEDRLYNKIVRNFLAPVFDTDSRISELLTGHVAAGGAISAAVIAKVAEIVASEKKQFNENNPAPLCTPALVLDSAKNFEKEFIDVVGVAPSAIKPSDVKTYSRSLGVLLAVNLPAGASAPAIVRAVLSYRHLLADQQAKAKLARKDRDNYYDGLRAAARSGIELGFDDNKIIEDFKYYLNRLRENDSRELCRLRSNYYKIRERLDVVCADLAGLCPSLVDMVGGSYIVHLDRAKKMHISAKIQKEYISKYRSLVADLTRINAALFGVTNF